MKTIGDKLNPGPELLAEAEEAALKRARQAQIEKEIMQALPQHLPCPGISNMSDTFFFGKPGAWVSWSFYMNDDRTPKASVIMKALEQEGWRPVPASLCQWDNYARAVEPGLVESIPLRKYEDRQNSYKLNDCSPLAPLWFAVSQYGSSVDVCAFYQRNGYTIKVLIDAFLPVSVSARKIGGGRFHPDAWRYDSGTAAIHYPKSWFSVELGRALIATVSSYTRARCVTEQGLDGCVYLKPCINQADMPATSVLMELLENTYNEKR